jgi:hypothetical protein
MYYDEKTVNMTVSSSPTCSQSRLSHRTVLTVILLTVTANWKVNNRWCRTNVKKLVAYGPRSLFGDVVVGDTKAIPGV